MKIIFIIIVLIALLATNILVFDKKKWNNFLESVGEKSEKIYETIIGK
jgi:hypothetical protein|tara:strand:- start:507 stop:650 length:144 start_codon:yes stop_codon:yes gene_type:complete